MPVADADAGRGSARAIVSSYPEEGVMAGHGGRTGPGRRRGRGWVEGGEGGGGEPRPTNFLAGPTTATLRPASLPLTSRLSPPRVAPPPPSFARLPPETLR